MAQKIETSKLHAPISEQLFMLLAIKSTKILQICDGKINQDQEIASCAHEHEFSCNLHGDIAPSEHLQKSR